MARNLRKCLKRWLLCEEFGLPLHRLREKVGR